MREASKNPSHVLKFRRYLKRGAQRYFQSPSKDEGPQIQRECLMKTADHRPSSFCGVSRMVTSRVKQVILLSVRPSAWALLLLGILLSPKPARSPPSAGLLKLDILYLFYYILYLRRHRLEDHKFKSNLGKLPRPVPE